MWFHSRDDIYCAADKTKEDIGPVNILVNNAGIVSGTSILDTPISRIVKTFEVNVLAHFWTIKVRKDFYHGPSEVRALWNVVSTICGSHTFLPKGVVLGF